MLLSLDGNQVLVKAGYKFQEKILFKDEEKYLLKKVLALHLKKCSIMNESLVKPAEKLLEETIFG